MFFIFLFFILIISAHYYQFVLCLCLITFLFLYFLFFYSVFPLVAKAAFQIFISNINICFILYHFWCISINKNMFIILSLIVQSQHWSVSHTQHHMTSEDFYDTFMVVFIPLLILKASFLIHHNCTVSRFSPFTRVWKDTGVNKWWFLGELFCSANWIVQQPVQKHRAEGEGGREN